MRIIVLKILYPPVIGCGSIRKGFKIYYNKIESAHMRVNRQDDIYSFYKDFFVYPARKVHHNYYHGLIQHTLKC